MSKESRTLVERVYVLNGGVLEIADASIYSPGIDVGRSINLPCHAYLMRRANEWILWDTGTSDKVAEVACGQIIEEGIRSVVHRTLGSQLEEIGVDRHDVTRLMLSHAHFDHVGNTDLFPNAEWIVHRREFDAMFGSDDPSLGYYDRALYETLRDNPTTIVEEDHDVFGDRSVLLLATPGHTPGHCSLAIQLPDAGAVVLSGDAVHFQQNLAHRRVPGFNFDAEQTRRSMDKIVSIMEARGARLWINHDPEQAVALPHAPAWIG